MSMQEQEFIKKLLETFRDESRDHLATMLDGLLALEKKPTKEAEEVLVETIHREAHSLKGAARAVNLTNVEGVCKNMEDFFSAWKQEKIKPNLDHFDLLHQAIDVIEKILASDVLLENANLDEVNNINSGLQDVLSGKVTETVERKKIEKTTIADRTESVRIPVSRLTTLLLQAEEMISIKLFADKRLGEITELDSLVAQCKKDLNNATSEFEKSYVQSICDGKSNSENSTLSSKMTDMLNVHDCKFNLLTNKISNLKKEVLRDNHAITFAVDNLLEDAKKMLMMPFSILLNMFPKMIRDIARDKNKAIDFSVKGAETEIDKRILDEIKDVLIHIVRNAIDHGIESPEIRSTYHKTPEGKISISIFQPNRGEVEIIICDDGQGIDIAAIKLAVAHMGIMSGDELSMLSDEQVIDLVYLSGLSTKKAENDISGQGLGMAIVKETIEKLGGQVTIKSQFHIGTEIHITLPVTISTFKGILFQVETESFVAPVNHIERVIRVRKDEIKSTAGQNTITVDGEVIPLQYLSEILQISNNSPVNEIKFIPLLITYAGGRKSAMKVDAILNEMDVCVKNITGEAATRKIISGATVLGNGQVIPILNILEINKLVSSFSHITSENISVEKPFVETQPNILLVDDSITTRMLLKNIVETAGFSVTTAVDGVDAWGKIKLGNFSLIITDIEMPNMDGFELTQRIRQDQKTAAMPVVIITTRESQEDRIRGIDAGADAYVIKKGLNDSNLIDIIRELAI